MFLLWGPTGREAAPVEITDTSQNLNTTVFWTHPKTCGCTVPMKILDSGLFVYGSTIRGLSELQTITLNDWWREEYSVD